MQRKTKRPSPFARPVPRRVAACGVLAFALAMAGEAAAQLIRPPQSVWGQVDRTAAGLEVGGAEWLTSLLMALLLAFGTSLFLAFRHRQLAWLEHGTSEEMEAERIARRRGKLRRILGALAYGVAPLLAVVTMVVSGGRTLFGVEVALVAAGLAAASAAVAAVTLLRA